MGPETSVGVNIESRTMCAEPIEEKTVDHPLCYTYDEQILWANLTAGSFVISISVVVGCRESNTHHYNCSFLGAPQLNSCMAFRWGPILSMCFASSVLRSDDLNLFSIQNSFIIIQTRAID